jgi:hypothetical protein
LRADPDQPVLHQSAGREDGGAAYDPPELAVELTATARVTLAPTDRRVPAAGA